MLWGNKIASNLSIFRPLDAPCKYNDVYREQALTVNMSVFSNDSNCLQLLNKLLLNKTVIAMVS